MVAPQLTQCALPAPSSALSEALSPPRQASQHTRLEWVLFTGREDGGEEASGSTVGAGTQWGDKTGTPGTN